jgi:hypothetical protein
VNATKQNKRNETKSAKQTKQTKTKQKTIVHTCVYHDARNVMPMSAAARTIATFFESSVNSISTILRPFGSCVVSVGQTAV